MKWIRYQDRKSGQSHHGMLAGEHIEEIAGLPFGKYAKTGRSLRLADVRLLPPVVPPTFYAAGVNYPHHLKTHLEKLGKPFVLPKQSDIGYRANNALIAHGDDIVVPRDSAGKLQYEGELVVVIGKEARDLSEQEALSCVFGYTIGNDISERAWQSGDRTLWRAKNCDTFKPMGPWIETEVDLDALTTTVRLNGRQVSHFRTNDMIFGVEITISTISRYITLHPGDMIWMGTDDPTLDMVAGDTVEVEISGLGVLRNSLVAQA